MSLPTTLLAVRKAQAALAQAEHDILTQMKVAGIPMPDEQKRKGRPVGSKNRPKVSPQPPEALVG